MNRSRIWGYTKAIVGVLGTVAVVVQSAVTDDSISTNEWVKIGIAAVTAAGVYLAPNKGYVNKGGETAVLPTAKGPMPAGEDGLGRPV